MPQQALLCGVTPVMSGEEGNYDSLSASSVPSVDQSVSINHSYPVFLMSLEQGVLSMRERQLGMALANCLGLSSWESQDWRTQAKGGLMSFGECVRMCAHVHVYGCVQVHIYIWAHMCVWAYLWGGLWSTFRCYSSGAIHLGFCFICVCVHIEYMCLICICSIWTHICLFYVPLCVHTEAKGKWWEPSFLIPSLIPLRQGLSLDPELGWQPNKFQWSSCLPQLEARGSIPGFLHGCRGVKLRPTCLWGKRLNPPGQLHPSHYFEKGSVTELGACWVGWAGWSSLFPALQLWDYKWAPLCLAMYVGAGIQIWTLILIRIFLIEPSPQLWLTPLIVALVQQLHLQWSLA